MLRLAISGRLRAASMNLADVGGQERDVFARPVFEDESESAGRAHTLDGGGGKAKAIAPGRRESFWLRCALMAS